MEFRTTDFDCEVGTLLLQNARRTWFDVVVGLLQLLARDTLNPKDDRQGCASDQEPADDKTAESMQVDPLMLIGLSPVVQYSPKSVNKGDCSGDTRGQGFVGEVGVCFCAIVEKKGSGRCERYGEAELNDANTVVGCAGWHGWVGRRRANGYKQKWEGGGVG